MDEHTEPLAEADQLIRRGKAKAALSHVTEILESYVRHLATETGARRKLAADDPERFANVPIVDLLDFLIDKGVLRHRQKTDIRELRRLLDRAERESIGPSLEQANTALRFAREFIDRNETTAADLMRGPVVGLDRDKLVEDAVTIMRSRGVRQLPVLENGEPKRAVTPEVILRLVDEAVPDLARKTLWEVADRGLPKVSPDAKLWELLPLLRTRPAILVVDEGRIVGIIGPSDVLQVVRRYQ